MLDRILDIARAFAGYIIAFAIVLVLGVTVSLLFGVASLLGLTIWRTIILLVMVGGYAAVTVFVYWRFGKNPGHVMLFIGLWWFIAWQGPGVLWFVLTQMEWPWYARVVAMLVIPTIAVASMGLWVSVVYQRPPKVVWFVTLLCLAWALVLGFQSMRTPGTRSPLPRWMTGVSERELVVGVCSGRSDVEGSKVPISEYYHHAHFVGTSAIGEGCMFDTYVDPETIIRIRPESSADHRQLLCTMEREVGLRLGDDLDTVQNKWGAYRARSSQSGYVSQCGPLPAGAKQATLRPSMTSGALQVAGNLLTQATGAAITGGNSTTSGSSRGIWRDYQGRPLAFWPGLLWLIIPALLMALWPSDYTFGGICGKMLLGAVLGFLVTLMVGYWGQSRDELGVWTADVQPVTFPVMGHTPSHGVGVTIGRLDQHNLQYSGPGSEWYVLYCGTDGAENPQAGFCIDFPHGGSDWCPSRQDVMPKYTERTMGTVDLGTDGRLLRVGQLVRLPRGNPGSRVITLQAWGRGEFAVGPLSELQNGCSAVRNGGGNVHTGVAQFRVRQELGLSD